MRRLKGFASFLKELRHDPEIKKALDTVLRRRTSKKSMDPTVELLSRLLRLSAGFLGRRALKWIAFIELMTLLYQVSMAVNENVLKRPEVRALLLKQKNLVFSETQRLLQVTSSFIDSTLKKFKR